MFRTGLSSTLVLGCFLACAETMASEDFRVENEVFFGNRKKADSLSTTIFFHGRVYDYLNQPAEVIVLDEQGGRLVVLDLVRRVRTELTTEEVLAFSQRLQHRAMAHEDAFIKFLATPQFKEQFDKSSAELTLSSPWMTYRLLLVDAESGAISRQYREFCDWSARLNTLLNPGSRPPFARLAVNAAMAKREAIAREVHLTITPKKSFPPQRTAAHSRHRLVRRLAKADLDRVAQTDQFMKIFKPVEFREYRRAGQP